MATKLEIWNMALAKMGHTRQLPDVESMSTLEHKALALVYEPTVRAMLEETPWSFAKRVVVLDPFVESELPETVVVFSEISPRYRYMYMYPGDALDVRAVGYRDMDGAIATVPFEVLSLAVRNDGTAETWKIVATDAEGAWCEYISSRVVEDDFPPMFVTALTYRLAAELSLSLAGDVNKHRAMLELYNATFERSKERAVNEGARVSGSTISRYSQARWG